MRKTALILQINRLLISDVVGELVEPHPTNVLVVSVLFMYYLHPALCFPGCELKYKLVLIVTIEFLE